MLALHALGTSYDCQFPSLTIQSDFCAEAGDRPEYSLIWPPNKTMSLSTNVTSNSRPQKLSILVPQFECPFECFLTSVQVSMYMGIF